MVYENAAPYLKTPTNYLRMYIYYISMLYSLLDAHSGLKIHWKYDIVLLEIEFIVWKFLGFLHLFMSSYYGYAMSF